MRRSKHQVKCLENKLLLALAWFTYCSQQEFIHETSLINLDNKMDPSLHDMYLTILLVEKLMDFIQNSFQIFYDRTRPCYILSTNLLEHLSQRTFCTHCTLLCLLLSSASAQPSSVPSRSFQSQNNFEPLHQDDQISNLSTTPPGSLEIHTSPLSPNFLQRHQ